MSDDASTVIGRSARPGGARRVLVVMLDDAVTSHELPDRGEVVLGRGQAAQVRIDHPSVSRAHAALELGDVVRVRDLDSGNGTTLRGARLPARRAVEVGSNEAFQLGDVTVVVQERRARAAAPVPRSGPRGAAIAPVVLAPAMRNLFDLARRVAAGAINVLIVGESGAGKEVLARAIHAASPRAAGPLVEVNAAALADPLVESELFGHEKGAFTGAAGTKAGLIEAADGGTLFLDEIGELSAAAQAKMLRVIEERRVLRVGATASRPVDVRFVAATHRDLEADAATGRFRHDLYYRLAGVVLEVPPLRERREEIEPLARAFAAAAAAGLGRAAPEFAPDALAAMRAHEWPGNVRELRNAIDRAVLLAPAAIGAADLFGGVGARRAAAPAAPAAIEAAASEAADDAPPGLDADAADERARIVAALERCAGNQTRAAELLGMPRRTLVKRLGQYAIPRPKRG